jgi:hypothetical protein
VHYVLIVTIVVASLLSAGTGAEILGFPDWVVVAAGLLSAAAAALEAYTKPLAKADVHWKQRREFERLAHDYETLASQPEPPTRADLDALSRRYEEIQ